MAVKDIYKEIFINKLMDYKDSYMVRLNRCEVRANVECADVSDRIRYLYELEDTLSKLDSITIREFDEDITIYIRNYFIPYINDYSDKLAKVNEGFDRQISKLDSKRTIAINKAKSELESFISEREKIVLPVKDKHEHIVSKAGELESIFRIYGMDSNGYLVNTDEMSMKEINEILDLGLFASKNIIVSPKIIHKIVSLSYFPLVHGFENEDQNFIFRVAWVIGFILACYLAKPYFMAIIGFFYIIDIFANMLDIKEKESLLQMAYALTQPIDFDRFIRSGDEYEELVQAVKDAELLDDSDEKSDIELSRDEELEAKQKENPDVLLRRELNSWATYITGEEYLSEIKTAREELQRIKDSKVEAVSLQISKQRKAIEESANKVKLLGTDISMDLVMSLKAKVGSIEFEGRIVEENSIEMPFRNLLFTYDTQTSRGEVLDFMKLLLINTMCNIKEKHLDITVFDYLDNGKDFLEFLDPKLQKYISSKSTDFAKVQEEINKHIASISTKLRTNSIQEFNAKAIENGSVAQDYKLYIVLSTEQSLLEDRNFRSLMESSHDRGVFIWFLNVDEHTVDAKEREKYSNFYRGLYRINEYGSILDPETNSNIIKLSNLSQPYKYKTEMGYAICATYLKCIADKNRNVSNFDYEKHFKDKYIPKEKEWSFSTNKGIALRVGLVDGDPDKPEFLFLCDKPVHCLMGGTTGAGKSATINEMLASLLFMYPPEELELVMVDFKNVEFKQYTDELSIPHAKIIAGTKDGEYAISIFKYLNGEMARRTKLFGELKLQKLEDYNNMMTELGTPEKRLPRILVLIDEFQVMFTEVDPRALDEIKKQITALSKLARFCGCHLWFTSQSMKGTMSADILEQFGLRAALRCTEATSIDLIGNNASGKIKEDFGYIYTNTSGGTDPAQNLLWRIPFIQNSYIKKYIPYLKDRVAKENRLDRKPDFYNEEYIPPGSELLKVLENEAFSENPYSFVMGERTAYAENRAPNNFLVQKTDSENILAVAFETSSLLDLSQTFISNIKKNDKAMLLINCADKDSYTLLDLDNVVEEKFKPILDMEASALDIIDALLDEMEYRKSNPEIEHKVLYFMGINWEAKAGLGIDINYRLQDKFKALLYEAPKYDIHIILCLKEFKEYRTFKTRFKHRIGSYLEDSESTYVADSNKCNKISKEFAMYFYGSSSFKFKIYDFPLEGEIGEREITIMG